MFYVYPAFRTEPLSFIGRTWEKKRLHPGSNNFVKVDIAVSEGMRMDSSVSVQPEARDGAIFMSVVKNIVGCSYSEEREVQRDHAIRQWWDLLRLNMAMSDPGRVAVAEHGLVDVFG